MPTSVEIPTGSMSFDKFRNRNETELTYALKWAAWKWLWEVARCRVVGFEVRLEGPFGRIADVVGLGPENRVFLIEVKSTRTDLRRDDNNERTREKLVAKSKSLDRAVELTENVLSEAIDKAGVRGRLSVQRRACIRTCQMTGVSKSHRRLRGAPPCVGHGRKPMSGILKENQNRPKSESGTCP